MKTLMTEVHHKFTLATTYLQSAVQTFETLGLPDVFPTGVFLSAVCLPATPTPTTVLFSLVPRFLRFAFRRAWERGYVLLRENATCLDPVPWPIQSSFRAHNAIMTSLIYSFARAQRCSLTFRDPGRVPTGKYRAGRYLFSVQSNEKLEPGWGSARNYPDVSYLGS